MDWLSFGTQVDEMKTHSDNMQLEDMTIGISQKGMEKYREQLQHNLLISVVNEINNTQELETAINKNWQGQARDNFIEEFNKARKSIGEELKKEYSDLSARLIELEANYFSQDFRMMD